MPDEPSLKDLILKSESGRQMLEWVSPIYENSYVGLWLFEAIGREYDKLWDIVNTFALQLFPDSVTWAIELWERRYGITPPPGETLQNRRVAIVQKRQTHLPISPYRLEQVAEMITGNPAQVEDHVGPYTFGVFVTTDSQKTLREVRDAIRRLKPSHMSFEMTDFITASARATIYAATAHSGMNVRITAGAARIKT